MQIHRIFFDKIKILFMLLIFIIPSIEVIQILLSYSKYGAELPVPLYSTFLSSTTQGHILQSLLFWFLPLYLLIIVGDDCIEDYITGYKNILIGKMGKSKYLSVKLKTSFIVSFGVMFLGLLVNLILVLLILRGGTYLNYDGEYMVYDALNMPNTFLFEWSYSHPFIANMLFIVVTSLLSGLISMVGTSLAIVIHDRKIVYAVVFALWFAPCLPRNSLMLTIQPFAEYGLSTIFPIYILTVGFYLFIVIFSYIWEVKFATI